MSILQLKDVSCHLGTNKKILNEINYSINSGDFIVLLGTNGSGKSTLLKLLQGQHKNEEGVISFHKHPSDIVTLTQNVNDSLFTSLTVYENYLLSTKINHSRAYFAKYVSDFNPNLANKLNDIVNHLSGGEKQALALALYLLKSPTLLLLDEHTSALDPKTSQQIMQLTANKLKQHQITCILTTHDLDIALNYGNRILALSEGKILRQIETAEKNTLTRASLMQLFGT